MAATLKVFALILCVARHTYALSDNDAVKALVTHIKTANNYYNTVYKRLPKDFEWLGKSKVAKAMVAESISTMSEECGTSCATAKSYHNSICKVKADKVFPLIYGPLMVKGASDQGLCDKVAEDSDSFFKLCSKHCRTNTLTAMLVISREAQRAIDGDGTDSMEAEEGEEANDVSQMSSEESRLYEVDDETVDHPELMNKSDGNIEVPTWAIIVMTTSFSSLLAMGRMVYSLKKRLAVAEASGSTGFLPCEEAQLE